MSTPTASSCMETNFCIDQRADAPMPTAFKFPVNIQCHFLPYSLKIYFFYLLLIIGIIRQSNTFYFQYNIYFKLSWGQFLAVEMVASEDQFPHYTSHASECHCTPVCVVCNYFYLKQISLDPGKHLQPSVLYSFLKFRDFCFCSFTNSIVTDDPFIIHYVLYNLCSIITKISNSSTFSKMHILSSF